MRVIFPHNDSVAVFAPSGSLTIEEAARKHVPAGVPYRIVVAADVPDDKTFRDAWEADFSEPDGYGIGAKAWYIEQWQKEIVAIEGLAPTDDETVMQYRAARLEELTKMISEMEARP